MGLGAVTITVMTLVLYFASTPGVEQVSPTDRSSVAADVNIAPPEDSDLPEGLTRTITVDTDGTEHVHFELDLNTYDPAKNPGPPILPRPFTAAEIREHLKVGSQLTFQIDGMRTGKGTIRWTIQQADDYDVTIFFEPLGESAQDSPPGTQTFQWGELEHHATYPASFSTRTETRITTEAGEFDAWKYEVKPPGTEVVERFFFAKSLPGPPVRHEVYEGGRLVHTNVLVGLTMQSDGD